MKTCKWGASPERVFRPVAGKSVSGGDKTTPPVWEQIRQAPTASTEPLIGGSDQELMHMAHGQEINVAPKMYIII